MSYGYRCFDSQGYNYDPDRTRYWMSILNAESKLSQDGQWVTGFPHEHGWDYGRTLVHYVTIPASGGELVAYPGAQISDLPEWPEQVIEPKVGLSVIINGRVPHGVRPIGGSTDRLILIMTVYERGKPLRD